MKLNLLDLGKCQYDRALEVQYKLLEKRQKGEIDDTLILVEHPSVITLGRRAEEANIIISKELMDKEGIQLYETNRGGDVTYHGPGQLVGYPIVDIKNLPITIRNFVRGLEEVFIRLLKDGYQIEAGRDEEHTGVWVGNNKITAIGLAVKRGVTMHGFAFNINTILQHFNYIVPCGITNKGVTSMEKLMGRPIDFDITAHEVSSYFLEVFGYDDLVRVQLDSLLGRDV
ncbi:lipoyl(octanoyl) transferase LipB [Alkaliphilus serpentinus]|uniref:Octanoyltransferase n=1 Tax=Alkaliphilus serpentinus TaxID=1482731 RepID=A0A833HQK9_9FIRM|nr:lipoyl(octanoyl) transferase LipB [Alkaliphilus serpentinus]KAB3531137.1 lipoyl(octanoyl) transferase LipB [Alkaliphilus serpentinus]